MASDKERLEIVKKLRRTANDDLNGLSLQRNLAAITKAEDGSWRGVMRRLADLIDPTCRNVSGCKDTFECSKCRCKAELITEVCNEHGEPLHVPLMPLYCPNCRAMVVNGDE